MSTYSKLFSSILDSTIWETPAPVRIVWITMIAMADRDGIVEASIPGLARRAGVDRTQCEQALAMFMAPDPDSRTKALEGRRIEELDGGWRLVNYESYRDRMDAEDRRKKDAERQRRKRERDHAPSRDSHGPSENIRDITNITTSDQAQTISAQAQTRPEKSRGGSAASPRPPRKSPGHVLPGDWKPTAEHELLAKERGLDLDLQARTFRANAEANDRRAVRWNAAFTQWLLKSWPDRKSNSNDGLQYALDVANGVIP